MHNGQDILTVNYAGDYRNGIVLNYLREIKGFASNVHINSDNTKTLQRKQYLIFYNHLGYHKSHNYTDLTGSATGYDLSNNSDWNGYDKSGTQYVLTNHIHLGSQVYCRVLGSNSTFPDGMYINYNSVGVLVQIVGFMLMEVL